MRNNIFEETISNEECRYYSKPGYTYSLSTQEIQEQKLVELGFVLMESEWPGKPYVANADGTWGIDTVMAFELLRVERNKRLAETDYFVTSDYPLPEDRRTAVLAYRKALRDLPSQEGAPWDGAEHVPWPVLGF